MWQGLITIFITICAYLMQCGRETPRRLARTHPTRDSQCPAAAISRTMWTSCEQTSKDIWSSGLGIHQLWKNIQIYISLRILYWYWLISQLWFHCKHFMINVFILWFDEQCKLITVLPCSHQWNMLQLFGISGWGWTLHIPTS